MKNKSLTDLIKENKVMSIGIAIVLLILLFDSQVLKPMRRAKELQAQGIGKRQTTQSSQVSTASPAATTTASSGNLTAPSPISVPAFPKISENIDIRFRGNTAYPFLDGRNVFREIDKPVIVEIVQDVVEEVISKPDISYHGFYTVGNDKIAILRNSNEILLTRVGNKVRRTNYRLASISPEKVIVTDLSNKVRDFEISLADETESN